MLPSLLQADAGGGAFGMQILLFGVIFASSTSSCSGRCARSSGTPRRCCGAWSAAPGVVTSGGIHGTITGIQGDVVQLRVAENLKLQVSKSAVASVIDKKG